MMPNTLDSRRLRYFVTVAEEANFSKAARKLNMAQPPLSMQIRALENELGTPLIDRSCRPLRLTAAGESLLADARKIFAALDAARARATRASLGESGTLNVGYIPPLANEKLASILQAFRQRCPAVDLNVAEMHSHAQAEALLEGRIDVGFLRPVFRDKVIAFETAFIDTMVLAVPSDHAICSYKQLQWNDLKTIPLILVSPLTAGGLYDDFLKMSHRSPASSGEYKTPNDVHTALWLVSAGFGVTPTTSSMRHIQRANLTFLDLPSGLEEVRIVVAHNSTNRNPIISKFLEVVGKVLKNDGGTGCNSD